MKFTLLAGAFDELIDAYGVYAEYVLLVPPAAMLMTKSLAVAVVIDELLQAVEKQEPLEYVGLVPLSNPPSEAISNGKRTRLFVAENVAESVNDQGLRDQSDEDCGREKRDQDVKGDDGDHGFLARESWQS